MAQATPTATAWAPPNTIPEVAHLRIDLGKAGRLLQISGTDDADGRRPHGRSVTVVVGVVHPGIGGL